MARSRSPERDEAFKIYEQHKSEITNREIAHQLSISEKTVGGWKCKDKWDEKLNGVLQKKERSTPKNTKYSDQQTEYSKPSLSQCEATSHKTGQRCTKKARPGERFCHTHLDGWNGQCTAKSKQTGERCRRKAEPGKTKCRNHGGMSTGPPAGSKNALKTGEHETIWFDTLDDNEKELYGQIETDTVSQIDDSLRLLSLRERRMMLRIQRLKAGLTEKQKRVLQERRTIKEAVPVHDERTGETKVLTVPRDELVVSEVEETEFRVIDDIIRLEEALTRVQDKRIKAIEAKHRMVAKHGLDEERLQIEQERIAIEKARSGGGSGDVSALDRFLGVVDEIAGDADA